MLQAAKTDLFNTIVPKAHNSECQKLKIYYFALKMKPGKVNLKFNWQILIFCTIGTNGLISL